MKTAQYLRQEKAISAADSGGIRERWLYGLRLLRDAEAFNAGSSQLKPGVTDQLVASAKAGGRSLRPREIQYRLRAARTYLTESEIARACAQFQTWSALIEADFPAFDSVEGEAPADHRTDEERKRDTAKRLLDIVGEQGTLFPLDQFEPGESLLKDLLIYTEESEALTARFAKRDAQRRDYVDRLMEAAGYDLSVTWGEAHSRLGEPPLPT